MKEMSVRQKEIYDFIVKYHEENSISPSIRDISVKMGMGDSTVAAHLNALKKKGYITQMDRIPRSIKIIPIPAA